jgi:hypothetical protein
MGNRNVFPPGSAEGLAQRLLDCAATDGRLLRRAEEPVTPEITALIGQGSAQMDPRFHELVSLAIASARRADEAARQLRQAETAARRALWTAALVVAGTLAASAVLIAVSVYHRPAPSLQSAVLPASAPVPLVQAGPAEVAGQQQNARPEALAADHGDENKPTSQPSPSAPPSSAPAAPAPAIPKAHPHPAYLRVHSFHHVHRPRRPYVPPPPDDPPPPAAPPPFIGFGWGSAG